LLAFTTLIENAKKKIAELNRENNSFIKIKLEVEEFDKNCHIRLFPYQDHNKEKFVKYVKNYVEMNQ
jgi:hypothetical protein